MVVGLKYVFYCLRQVEVDLVETVFLRTTEDLVMGKFACGCLFKYEAPVGGRCLQLETPTGPVRHLCLYAKAAKAVFDTVQPFD